MCWTARLPNCHHVCIFFSLGNAIFFSRKILNIKWDWVLRPAGTTDAVEGNKLLQASIAAKQSDPADKNPSTPIKVQASLSYIQLWLVTLICLNSSWPLQDVLDSDAPQMIITPSLTKVYHPCILLALLYLSILNIRALSPLSKLLHNVGKTSH